MMNWNGISISADAHRIATAIRTATGQQTFPAGYNIGPVKSDLRRFYVATGGKRGEGGYEPNANEYRDLYNGKISGADLLAKGRGEAPKVPQSTPDASEFVTDGDDPAQVLAKAIAAMGGQKLNPEAVKKVALEAVDSRVGEVLSSMAGLIAEEVSKQVNKIEIAVAEIPPIEVDKAHKVFPTVVRYAANRRHMMLVGPAGSGKTFLAEQVANALGLPFYMTGKVADETKLTGFVDAGGTYRTTSFRRAYENGGVFLFDEMDGSSPDALVAFNAPLAGNWGDFPDGMVKRHPDFVAIAAANTFGRGADRQYVGREQLDAATLDRFAVIEMDYDEDLELAITCDRDWTLYVQKVRKAVLAEKVRHVVSPRASMEGGVMLKAGQPRKDVEEHYVWKGLEETVRNRVKAAMR
jgi:cobaltochelatase CobS